jgi:hypothetical protein
MLQRRRVGSAIMRTALFTLVFLAACAPPPADVLFVGGRIYTADEDRSFAEAMAVRGDEILFVGGAEEARRFAGPATRQVDLAGRLVLPGLHDAHLHPVGAMAVDTCSIDKKAMTLEELSRFVAACLAQMKPAPGEWELIELWEFERGNQPGERFKTIRAALDAAAPDNPVLLRGTDGHHFAVNSRALATARNADGLVVGLSAATLKREFADLAHYVGVDAAGEPNGRLTEDYIYERLDIAAMEDSERRKRLAHPERLMDVTLPRGITSFLDAAADPATLPIYDALLAQDRLKARASLALYFDPADFVRDGAVDFGALLAEAAAIRDRYRKSALVKADFLKLFADGVLEGDPTANPPTLPNAALSRPYFQPIFAWDPATEWVRVAGYVDLDSDACLGARRGSAEAREIGAFVRRHGHHPLQCAQNAGRLQHAEAVIREYVAAGDAAGFTFNIHAIGDRAVAAALDAIDGARADGSGQRHIVTHLQLVRPEDVARFAAAEAVASFTFAWATVDPEYDLSVLPFIDRVDGPAGIYDPDSYYMQNVYPARAIADAGALVIAGSDAPVDTRDPRPFVNIEGAVLRNIFGGPPLNAGQALSIFEAVDAYTINAATALKQDDRVGSLTRGKKADFIIVDQDIFALAAAGRPDQISETRVLETWFGGARAYAAER